MSSSPPSPESLKHEQTNESDVVCEGSLSLNQEFPNPPPNSDPETIPNQQPITDPEESIPEEEEDDDEEEGDEGTAQETLSVSSGMSLNVDPPITEPHVSLPGVTLTSPTGDPNARRGAVNKTKLVRGRSYKGKGKGKHHIKQQQAIEEKLQILMKNLNPIPFKFRKLIDLNEREELLKKLRLWDFAQTDFDSDIRVDLIAELVATYKAKARCSYVNGCRIMVNRADLGRAFKLPWKKEKEMGSDWEAASNDNSEAFIEWFASEFMLLHEDMWMMPDEVIEWLKVIRDGHPEKVDWAGLLWFMVERELKQGGQLRDCYYASHLQHLIKSQREDVFVKEEKNEAISVEESDKEAKEQEKQEEVVVNEGNVGVVGGPNTELTLGQDGEKEDETEDVEMKDVVEKCEDIDEEGEKEEEEEEEEEEDLQREWLLHGKNDMGEHFMQRCETGGQFVSIFEDKKEEEEIEEHEEDMDGEEEDEDKFHVFPNDDSLEGDGFTGNLLQAMETNQISFGSQDHQLIESGPSFFNNEGKRVIVHDNHISHHSLTESNKRLRIDDSWEQHKPLDFGMCMENIQQMTERARLLHEEKERALEQSNMNQQILLSELQKRDAIIEHLHKTRLDEMQKKDGEIYRLERELYLMGSVLDGYRKALKETQKVFAEYREKARLLEEPTYKDAGPGGLMLTAAEIERREKKREEDYKMNCSILEQKMKEAEEDYSGRFELYVDKINLLDKRLMGLEAGAKEIVKLYDERKIPQNNEEEKVLEVAEEALPIEEKVPEVAEEALPIEEKVAEVAEEAEEALPIEEKVSEVAEEAEEALPIEEKVPEVAEEAEEALPIEEKEEKAGEDKESVEIPENQESEANPETREVAELVPDE